jgi:serine/threonine-protein kinase RsbW
MAAEAGVTELTLESTLKSVEVAEEIAHRVCAKAGFDEEDQHKIEMAVHESVINAVAHGNRHDASKKVYLRFEIRKDRLEIRIRDQGAGFDPSRVPDPLAVENLLKVSGRGIFLIRTFMDEFRVESIKGSGTEVTMVKRIDSKMKDDEGGTDCEHEGHNTPS